MAEGNRDAGAMEVSGKQERALIKFSVDGDSLWQKTYPHKGNGSIRGVDVTRDGGFLACGYVGSGERGYQFIFDDAQGSLLKINVNDRMLKTFKTVKHRML